MQEPFRTGLITRTLPCDREPREVAMQCINLKSLTITYRIVHSAVAV